MNTTIDLSDPRTRRAIPIAADAGQWARVTNRHTGQVLFGIPSSKPNVLYLTDAYGCSCPDHTFNPSLDCKHILAVNIWLALRANA